MCHIKRKKMMTLNFSEYLSNQGLNIDKDKNVIDYIDKNRFKEIRYYIMGKVGTGKTLLAKQICFWRKKLFVKITPDNISKITSEDIFSWYENMDVIIFDDLGAEMLSEREKAGNILLTISRYLENSDKGLIITTNLNSDDLREYYSDRIFDRIIGQLKILKLNQPSYRKQNMEIIK